MSLLDDLNATFAEVIKNPATFGEMADGTYPGKYVSMELTESKKKDPMVVVNLALDGKGAQTKKFIWLGASGLERGLNEILRLASGLGMPEDYSFSDIIEHSEEYAGKAIEYVVTSYDKKDKQTGKKTGEIGKNYEIKVLGDEIPMEDDDPFADDPLSDSSDDTENPFL